MAHDPRELVRLTQGRQQEPGAAVMDGRTVQSTPESRHRAGFDTRYAGHFGHERRKGSKVHAAVDTPWLRLTLIVTPANEQGRAQVEELASRVQAVTGKNVEVALVYKGHTGEDAAEATRKHGIKLVVIKHEQAKWGFILLPRRWVLKRSFAWTSRFKRLAKGYESLAETLKGLTLPSPICSFIISCLCLPFL